VSKEITKQLHLIGAGHHPDSSLATNPTYINSYIELREGSDGSSFTGICFPGTSAGISFGNGTFCAKNIAVRRCYIYSLRFSVSYSWSCGSIDNVLIENIFLSNLYAIGGHHNQISNNILFMLDGFGNYNNIRNNIFLSTSGNVIAQGPDISNSWFENNIFLASTNVFSYHSTTFKNNVFNNNLFVQNISFPVNSSTIGSNNIVNQPQSSIFVNQSGNAFNYAHDYHLQPTCPGKNAGRDGTDIGIYGGVSPWKDGSIPFNPHFQSITVAPTTDSTGNLNVNIKVEAQHR